MPQREAFLKKKKKCYTVNKLLRSNEPQANERTQWMDRKDCQTNPHFKKARDARSACPKEGLKNGAGSAKHATLARLLKGTRGEKLKAHRLEAMQLGRTLHSGTSRRAAVMQTCKQDAHTGMQTGRQDMHKLSTLGTSCNGRTRTCCQ